MLLRGVREVDKYLTLIIISMLGLSACKPSTVSPEQVTLYSIANGELPLYWGMSESCKVPDYVEVKLKEAWGQAEELIEMENSSKSDLRLKLKKVKLIVEKENVASFGGCLGSKAKLVETKGSTNLDFGSNADKCLSLSAGTYRAANKLLSLENCDGSSVSLGFATRIASRTILMSADWDINGTSRTFSTRFDFSVLGSKAGVNVSASGIATSILPLPPGAQGAVTAVVDSIGSVNFNSSFDGSEFVIADALKAKQAPKGTPTKLAAKIANDILKEACKIYQNKVNKNADCKLKSLTMFVGCQKELEKYRKMKIVNCEARSLPNQKFLYASVSRPSKGNVDLSPNAGDKLSLYELKDGVYKRHGWGTVLGFADKCGHTGNDMKNFECLKLDVGHVYNCGGFKERRILSIESKESFR